jgi:hypothetical protein
MHVPFLQKLCNAVYWLALTLWCSMLVAVAVAATGVFSKLLHTQIILPEFDSYDKANHGRLMAGMIMEPVFTFVDIAQLVLAFGVIITLVIQLWTFKLPAKRLANLVRIAGIVVAALLLLIRMTLIAPGMNRDLRAYWEHAQSGQAAIAEQHRAAFDAKHPLVSRMFEGSLVVLLVAVAASAAALGPASPRGRDLQEPRLLRMK